MSKKTYISTTGISYTFPVKVDDKVSWISFLGDQIDYSTSKKEIQEAIENHSTFKDGKIKIYSSDKKEDIESIVIPPSEFPEVTDINEALTILRKEPYRVHSSRLKSKEYILSVAKELGVSFPNLHID